MKGPGHSPARNRRCKVTHNFWITKQLHLFCKIFLLGDGRLRLCIGGLGFLGINRTLRIPMQPKSPMMPMIPMQPKRPMVSVLVMVSAASLFEAGACHGLADAAFVEEVLFEPLDKASQEFVALKDQRDGDICYGGIGACLYCLPIIG